MPSGKWNSRCITLCCSLLLTAAVAWGRTFPATSDPTLADQERWGSAFAGYVVSGCVHGPGAGTTATVPSCRAFVLVTTAPQRLLGFEETTPRTIPYSAGDGTYWLGGRSDPATTPPGWTCLAGLHYCTIKSATRPAVVSGLVLLQQTTVLAGAISATDPVSPQPQTVYLPERYGASGDGVSDDTAAWRAMIAAMPSSGSTVHLTRGATYYLNTADGVTFDKAVHLAGEGMDASTITCGTGIGNHACVTIQGHGSVVRDLTVIGDQTNFTNAEVFFDEFRHALLLEGDHTWVERVHIREAIVGVHFKGTTGGGVRSSRLDNTVIKRGSHPACHNSAGILGSSSDHWKVEGNWVTGFGQSINAFDTSVHILVHGNSVAESCDNGIYLASVDYSTVSMNHVTRMGQDGIKLRGSVNAVLGNQVSVEEVGNPARTGISMSGYLPPVAGISGVRLLVAHNTILCDCYRGIFMGNDSSAPEGGVRDGIVANNIIRFLGQGNDPAKVDASGIRIQGTSEQITVIGNVIQDAPHIGIGTTTLVGMDLWMRNLVIQNNTIHTVGSAAGANKGMHLGNIDGCLVSGNSVSNVLESDPGIHLITVKNCDFVNNTVGSTTTPPSTGTIITESSAQIGLTNIYRNNRTTGVTLVTLSIASGSTAKAESNEMVIGAAAPTDVTIQPGQAQRWLINPTGGTRTVNVSPIWPSSDVMVCNRSGDGSNLTFAPLAQTIVPNACAWYQVSNPATFWRFAPTP